MLSFFTIGVFNSKEEEFFDKLIMNNIDTFCDIRQRRGVRGKKYAFVNSSYLQKKLADCGIRYIHVKALAPTGPIRQLQKKADEEAGESNVGRKHLDPRFIFAYQQHILKSFDVESFIKSLTTDGCTSIALFCVEEEACACHRSLVAKRISEVTKSTPHNL